MERKTVTKKTRFLQHNNQPLKFISSGCAVLDCVLGGGYAVGRIVNIVGDKSTGKTLLAIEACANFAKQYDVGLIRYNESEAAFDKPYAAALGLPLDRVEFTEGCYTVEEFFFDLDGYIKKAGKSPGFYILDSLDALSDKAELERDIDAGSFGAVKAKKMSELFRRLVKRLQDSNITLFIISQVRDAIGVTFGDKTSRSGGRALDFYASQVLYLSQIGTLKRAANGVERPIGLQIKAKCKKNKLGPPLRECTFDLRFNFGIDDVAANINFLKTVKALSRIKVSEDSITRFTRALEKADKEHYTAERERIATAATEEWHKVEQNFLPTRGKY